MGGVSFGPCPWHEVVDARCGPEIDELVEDVGDVGLRLDVVELARLCRPPNYAESVVFPRFLADRRLVGSA